MPGPTRHSLQDIAEYRKKTKVYDVFTFFNELDLLEIRLNILNPYVDYFVIVESTQTFSGLPKKLFFEEHRDRFKQFSHKILHHITTDTPDDEADIRNRLLKHDLNTLDIEIMQNALTSDNVPSGVTHWLKEFYQKESIKKAFVGLADDDICFVSDVDEIWNPKAVIDFTKDDIFKLKQDVYVYYLNNRSNEPWAGTLVTKYKNIKNNCLNHLRTANKTKYTYVENGGWHFTNQGGAERIREKVEASYGPEDFNTDAIKSKIDDRMAKNQDYVGRKFKFWKDESRLPAHLLNNRIKYQHLFSPSEQPRNLYPDTIILKVHGGLGNQFFQYALGRNLSLSRKVIVKYDLSWFDTQTKRKFELDKYHTSAEIASRREVNALLGSEGQNGFRGLLRRLFKSDSSLHVQEKGFQFQSDILNTPPPAYLDGYWQSEKYFQGAAETIRRDLTLVQAPIGTNAEMLKKIQSSRSISVHVRRGDYVSDQQTSTFHGTSPLAYYRAAIEKIKTLEPNGTIFVFSDDHQWVKENLRFGLATVFVDINSPENGHEDLRLMAACRHHIIANSTFSWWGAWLNPNPQKVVIAPKKWFNDPTINTNDLLPSNWITI